MIYDLRYIYKTIEADTSQAADVWFRGLEAAIFSLETHPARGVPHQNVPICATCSTATNRTSTEFSIPSAKTLK